MKAEIGSALMVRIHSRSSTNDGYRLAPLLSLRTIYFFDFLPPFLSPNTPKKINQI